MKSQKSQKSQLGGNTCTPRCRTWFFTLNNYEKSDISEISEYCKTYSELYAFQEETGDNGTPHLQGCIRFKNQKKFDEIHNKWPKMHLEICKNWKQAVNYCTKKGS